MVAPTHWGVDSTTAATYVKNKKTGQTLWDRTVQQFGRQPEFWGRYLNASGDAALTSAEVNYLHGRGCRIVPVVLVNPQNISTEAAGIQNAQSAIDKATALGIPNSVFIYADLEWNYKPSESWIRGWWKRMKTWMATGCGGFYCTPVATNVNFPVPYGKAVQAASEPRTFRRVWATWPNTTMWLVPKGPANLSKVEFKPDQPPSENVSALWQYFLNSGAQIPPDELPDLDLAIDEAWNVMWKPPQHVPTSQPHQHRVDLTGDAAVAPGGGGAKIQGQSELLTSQPP